MLHIINGILIVSLLFVTSNTWGQYTSKAVTGNYEDASSWSSTAKPTDGNVTNALTIVANAIITRNGDLVKQNSITLNGKLIVTGNYSETSWDALKINSPSGELVVNGNFSTLSALTVAGKLTVNGVATPNTGQALTISSTAIVNFNNSLTTGPVEVAGVLNVTSSFTINNNQTLKITKDGKVEIWGDFNATAGAIDIQKGGILIVHGNSSLGNTGSNVQGDFITLGNLTMNGGTVYNTGNIIVGGDFTSTGWVSIQPNGSSEQVYFLNPNATITAPANSDISNGYYGDVNDFLDNETAGLISIVSEVAGSSLSITPVWYSYASGNWNGGSVWTLDSKTATITTSMTITNTNGTTSNITSASDLAHVITSGKTITIPAGTNASTANKITINTGGTLILAPGSFLTANGNITNNGTFKLQHTYTSPSSFINNGTITGNTTIEQTLLQGRNWYIGSAMNTNSHIYYSTAPTYFQYYNTAGKAWANITDNDAASLTQTMRGFYINYAGSGTNTITQTGTLYSSTLADQSIGLSNGGDRWNLVANPFASYVSLVNTVSSTDPATNPNWDFSKIEPTVYVRTKEGSTYKFLTFNLSTNIGSTGITDGLIAPMQSFWVRAKASTSGSITVKKTARVNPASTQSLKAASASSDILRIQSSSINATDEAIIVFRAIGSDTDTNIDSEKRVDSPGLVPQIFTQKSGKNIAINVMPEDPTAYTIPLAITVGAKGAGDITLNASNITEFMPNVNVYLKDLSTGTVTDLRQSPSYTFTTEAATAQNRFELSFSKVSKAPQVATSTDVNESQNASITAYGIGTKAVVTIKDVSFSGNVQIEMYDAVGKQLISTVSQEQRTELPLNGSTQFVVIKVTYNGTTKSFKIMKSIRMM